QLAKAGLRGLPGRAVDAGLESGIAQTMESTLGHQQTLARLGQVGDDLLGAGIDHGGAYRYSEHHILALGAGAVGAAAVLAPLGVETAGIAGIEPGGHAGV